MIGIERRILVPLGDTSTDNMVGVAFSEARALSRGILDEEDTKDQRVTVTIVSLQRTKNSSC